jgi:hypothetical protein
LSEKKILSRNFLGSGAFYYASLLQEQSMFRPSDSQRSLFDARGLLPEEKRRRCETTWAEAFRLKALPILRRVETEFADLFDPEVGRPNRPVELVLGVLLLKEINDLTDQQALDALEWHALWWWAFEREPRGLHLCQKTLHNFRTAVLEHDKAKVAFRRVTDELIAALGIDCGKQRLDSTQIVSNIAMLSRLGVFCETVRLFLRAVKRVDAKAYEAMPAGLLRRHGEDSCYADARREDGPRRLGVVARDLWRLSERFEENPAVIETPEWGLLQRLLNDQCEVSLHAEPPKEDDDDRGEGAVPMRLREPKKVRSDSLQTPHDPDVTYSGHKGKGYSAQVAETCNPDNPVQVITEVMVTPACASDAQATVPMVDALKAAQIAPRELVADTTYSGATNAAELGARDVRLVAPAPAQAKPTPHRRYAPPAPMCPSNPKQAAKWLKRQEAAPDFKERYAPRAGIEATNSELKRAHGLGKLRVRGGLRVRLAFYFKALACNLKRALRRWQAILAPTEGAVARA